MKDAPYYSDSEKKQDRERKREERLEQFRQGIIHDLGEAWLLWEQHGLTAYEKMLAFQVRLEAIAANMENNREELR